MAREPRTLQQAIQYFTNPDNCIDYLAVRRWKDGAAVCPTCGSKEVRFLTSRRVWCCKARHLKWQFSIKVGTIFEDSPIGLDKWLTAMWMLANCRNGASSWEMHRTLGVTQKTAWFMLQRIRLALQDEKTGGKLGGEIEIDETFIGGKARNMHAAKRRKKIQCPGPYDKVPVMGILERGGKVRTFVVPGTRKKQLQTHVREHVEAGSAIFTDELKSYVGLDADYAHEIINHAVEYVRGNVHTNGLENFWSLLKRGLRGTYVSVEPFHLFRYLDEQVFRFNNRKDNDSGRFVDALRNVVGRRVTYKALTGNALPETC